MLCTIPMAKPTPTVTPMLRKRPTNAAPRPGTRKPKVNTLLVSWIIDDASTTTTVAIVN